jgi:transcriptional regulator with XRE-family HTH domain
MAKDGEPMRSVWRGGGIERGERNPSLKNIGAIAKALGTGLPELFEFGRK